MGKINGKTLINMGYTPDKWFGKAIKKANSEDLTEEELIKYIKTVLPKPKIDPHKETVKYFKNIKAESEEEKGNVHQVFKTMDELMKTPTVLDGAVMPDSCPTGAIGQIPVGGVVVTKNAIHPSMHSADICCSVMATNLGKVDPKKVLDIMYENTHFGIGGREEFSKLPKDLEDKIKNNTFLNDEKSIQLSKTHLGTQGDGNHFAFIGKSEKTGDTIMVTHHGSRGFGARLYKKGMRAAERFRRELSPKTMKRNAWVPYDTKEGKDYWKALQIIREWTKLNHTVLHNKVVEEIEVDYTRFWNEHNFVFKDNDKFYHAKGATPLDDRFVPDSNNGLRLIPLNMSEPVLIVKGETTESNLGFAPHGAGRNISRTAHKRKKGDDIEKIFKEEIKGLDIKFYSGKVDITELPSAYKNADSVQRQMEEFGLGNVVDRVLPYGCIMAGEIEKPWLKK